MAERRETGREKRPRNNPEETVSQDGERIAKYLARAGIASRRACETLIADGQVSVNGQKVTTPAFKVSGSEDIRVAGEKVSAPEPTRLWRYHKPAGLITTNTDPAGRRTIFDELPKSLPRTVTVGRLDLNTEGLLLLTNDGALARALELPDNQVQRTYRARAHGRVTADKLKQLATGMTVDGERFGSIEAELERETGTNNWLKVSLAEGRKREVRRALEAVGLQVNRLIRTSYGPFELDDLSPGSVEEVPATVLAEALGELMPKPKRPLRKQTSPKSGLDRRKAARHPRRNRKRT